MRNKRKQEVLIASKARFLQAVKTLKRKEDRTIFVIPRILVRLLDGDLHSALMFSQMLWWSDHTSDPEGWFYKSGRHWQEELLMTRHVVQKSLRHLEGTGFIEVLYRKVNRDRLCHYRVLEKPLMDALNKHIESSRASKMQGDVTPSGTVCEIHNAPLQEFAMPPDRNSLTLYIKGDFAEGTDRGTLAPPSGGATGRPEKQEAAMEQLGPNEAQNNSARGREDVNLTALAEVGLYS